MTPNSHESANKAQGVPPFCREPGLKKVAGARIPPHLDAICLGRTLIGLACVVTGINTLSCSGAAEPSALLPECPILADLPVHAECPTPAVRPTLAGYDNPDAGERPCVDAVDPRIDPADDVFTRDPAVLAKRISASEGGPGELSASLQNADVDGDGKRDTVEIVASRHGSDLGFRVQLATGEIYVLGAGRPALVRFSGPASRRQHEAFWRSRHPQAWEDDLFWEWGPRETWPEHDECYTDLLGGLAGWSVLKRSRRGGFRISSHGVVLLHPPGAIGDAILLDGGDAFGIYYFDGLDWRWVHPGV